MSSPAVRANAIDRLIGWVNPGAGLRRYFDRLRLARAYEAASPRDGWRPKRAGASANADHYADAGVLRAKARALVQNVPYVAAGLDALVAQTIGTGIMPRSTAPGQADLLNTLWARWVSECDADGRLDFYGLEAAAYRAMEQDGEVLIRRRPRFVSDGYAVPMQLQLLEIDWLDTSRVAAEGSNEVVNGIEYDPLGRVVAYWLWDQHPGDITLRRGTRTQSKRVPASSIIHLYRSERPGQGRGFSRLAPVIARVRDLQLYEDAVLARKNLEARLGVLATGDVAMMANLAAYDGTADTANATRTGDLGQLSSGGITQLPPGLNLEFIDPKSAGGEVGYVVHQLHLIAAGMGVTYEMLTGDMSQVNYSSARVRLMDLRRQIEQVQWLCLVPNFLTPVWRAFVDSAQLAGKINRADYSVEFSTPKWEYVNPSEDVQADLDAIGGGLQSQSETIRRRGYDPDAVRAEMLSDFQSMANMEVAKGLSLLDVLLVLQRGRVSQDITPMAGKVAGAPAKP